MIRQAIGTLAVLQVLDIASTILVLAKGGMELNPIALFFMATLGIVPGLIALKAIVFGLILVGCSQVHLKTIWILNYVYVFVVGWNLYTFYTM